MGYRLDNKYIKIKIKSLPKIASGKTGDVYKYKDSALKVFNKEISPLDEETANYLTTIQTERILLPQKLLFYNNTLKGYTLKKWDKKGSGKRIITLPKKVLLNEVIISERDTERLSKRRVLLNGVSPENAIFNGELYLTDPSLYSTLELLSANELEKLNNYQFHLLLTELIVQELRKSNFSKAEISRIKDLFASKDNNEKSSEFIKSILSETNNTIKQFVKTI